MKATAFPPMSRIKTEKAAYNVGKTIGSEIKALGFNLNLAPVADVATKSNRGYMKGRSFGGDTEKVSKLIEATVKGFNKSGILCTLKHFPGHGNALSDSHNGSVQLNRTLEQLRSEEFPPFKSGIDAGAQIVMLGHLSAPKVTGNNLPAVFSPEIIKILREEIGFEGLIMTDALEMEAITDNYSNSQVGVIALKAGVDIILMPKSLRSAFNGILAAVKNGKLTEERIDESVLKILKVKYSSGIIQN